MYAIARRGDSEMTEQKNQQRQVSLETFSEQVPLEEAAAVAEASSINLNSETLPQLVDLRTELLNRSPIIFILFLQKAPKKSVWDG